MGLLVQWCCGEGGALQTNVTGMCGEHSQCPATLGLRPLMAHVLSRLHCSGSRPLSRERAPSCVRCQFPGPPQRCSLGWACILCLALPSSSGSRSLTSALSPGAVRLIPSAGPASVSTRWSRVASGELVSGRDPPGGCQPSSLRKSLVRDWKPVCSLVGDAVSGVSLPLSPPPCLLPPDSGWGVYGLVRSSSLVVVVDASAWGTFLLGVGF